MRDRPLATDGLAAEPDSSAAVAGRLQELLDLRPDDLLVGLGATASGPCRALVDRVSLRHQIVLVAPRGNPCALPPPAAGIRRTDMTALEFARFPMQCHKIVLDGELLEADGADDLLSLLFDRLEKNGRLVAVVHTPGHSIAGARGRVAAIAARLHKTGFDLLYETVTLPPDRYDLVGGTGRFQKPGL